MSRLAIFGGTPQRTKPFPSWPAFEENEEKALVEVLRTGQWWRYSYGEAVEAPVGARLGVQALAQVDDSTRREEVLCCVERPTTWKGQRVRALHPVQGPDAALFEAVAGGEFLLKGFRNRDRQGLLFAKAADSVWDKRRRSAWVSRKICLLRAHGLIQKVAHENRSLATKSGRQIITTVLAARKASVSRLSQIA